MNGFIHWLAGVIAACKPAVAAFFRDVGAMIANRPAPAGEVVVSMAVLVVLIVTIVPRVFKKVTAK